MTGGSGVTDPFWDGVVARVRADEDGRQLSLADAERRLAAGADAPLGAATIERLVRRATGRDLTVVPAPIAPVRIARRPEPAGGAVRSFPRRLAWSAAAAFFAFCLTTSSSSEQVVQSWRDGQDLTTVIAALENEFDVEARQHGLVFVSTSARNAIFAIADAGVADLALEARVELRRGWLLAVVRDETAAPIYGPDTIVGLRAAVATLSDPASSRSAREAAIDTAAESVGALVGLLRSLARLDESLLDSAESAWLSGDGEAASVADSFSQLRASLEALLAPPSGN